MINFVQFCDDFNLIMDNCEAYNGSESEYTQQARELKEEFYNLVGIYFDDSEVEEQQRCSMAMMISPPREPTSSSNTGPGICDEVGEEMLSNQGYNEVNSCSVAVLCGGGAVEGRGVEETEMETGGHIHSDVMAAGSDDNSVGDSEEDLPSFKDIFSCPNKI